MPVATRLSTTRSARSASPISASSVISMRSREAGTPWRTSALLRSAAQPSVQQRRRRHVDGAGELDALLVPPGDLVQGGVDDVPRQLAHDAGLLGERDEGGRRQQAALRMVPAYERLDVADGARLHRELRLIVQDELVGPDRVAQLADEREALARVAVAVALVEGVAASRRLRLVHRDVGALQERLGVIAMLREERDADARADAHVDAVD